MQGPGTVDVTAAEEGSAYLLERASRAAGYASLNTRLHSPHAAASLAYSPLAVQG